MIKLSIFAATALFIIIGVWAQVPNFKNDDFIGYYRKTCNDSVLNETLVIMDKCLFKKAGGVMNKIVTLDDHHLPPTKMKCESVNSWVSL